MSSNKGAACKCRAWASAAMLSVMVAIAPYPTAAQHHEPEAAPRPDPVLRLPETLPTPHGTTGRSAAMPRLRRSESSLREPDITLEGVPEDEHDDVAGKARNYVRRQLKPPSSKKSKLDAVRFEKVGDRYLVWWEYDDYSVTLANGRPGYRWSWGVWVTPDELSPPEVATADPASRPAVAPETADEPAARPLPEPPKPPEPAKAGTEPAATPDAPKSTALQPKAAEPETTEPKSTIPSDTPRQEEPSATPKVEPKTADAQPDAEPPAAKPRPKTTPSQPVSEPVLLPE